MKDPIILRRMVLPFLCSLGMAALTGCSITEPEDSAVKENTPPETRITSGPKEGGSSSYFVRIAWAGQDNDGIINGYNLVVDGQNSFVTISDSTFKFSAANQNEQHTISVAAVDNKGAADPTPATLTFTATNAEPATIIQVAGNPPPGATFGRGAIFTIAGEDVDNGPEFSYRYKIDDGAWSAWLTNPVIEFSANSPFGLLPEGNHTFYAQVRDAGLAVDTTPAEFPLVVSAAVKPGVVLNPLQNQKPFYEDNSAFAFPAGTSVQFSWSPIFNYAGGVSTGSRYRIDGGAWTEYSTAVSSLQLTNVTPGVHTFEVEYRDLAGTLSDIQRFEYEIVTATLNAGVLITDDGNGQLAGRPAATGDANAKAFYNQIFTALGARYAIYDVLTQGNPTPKRGLGRYSTVLWQSDEANFLAMVRPINVQLLTEYLTLGGKLWIVGWRGVNNLAGTTPVPNFDPAQPNAPQNAAFVWNYLKIASTRQTPGSLFDFNAAIGAAGHPNMAVELAKNPIPNRPGLSPIDVFTLRTGVAGAEGIYTFGSASGNPDFAGQICGVKYLGTDFRTATFGFPLYHMTAADAQAAAQKILQDFGEL